MSTFLCRGRLIQLELTGQTIKLSFPLSDFYFLFFSLFLFLGWTWGWYFMDVSDTRTAQQEVLVGRKPWPWGKHTDISFCNPPSALNQSFKRFKGKGVVEWSFFYYFLFAQHHISGAMFKGSSSWLCTLSFLYQTNSAQTAEYFCMIFFSWI